MSCRQDAGVRRHLPLCPWVTLSLPSSTHSSHTSSYTNADAVTYNPGQNAWVTLPFMPNSCNILSLLSLRVSPLQMQCLLCFFAITQVCLFLKTFILEHYDLFLTGASKILTVSSRALIACSLVNPMAMMVPTASSFTAVLLEGLAEPGGRRGALKSESRKKGEKENLLNILVCSTTYLYSSLVFWLDETAHWPTRKNTHPYCDTLTENVVEIWEQWPILQDTTLLTARACDRTWVDKVDK